MRKIIRSIVYMDSSEKTKAHENLVSVRLDHFLNLAPSEANVLQFILDFFVQTAEPPALQLVHDHFENLGQPAETVLCEETIAETFYEGATFKSVRDEEVESQSSANLTRVCKESIKIATQGITTKGSLIKGTDAAIAHLFSSAKETPKEDTGRMSSSMRLNSAALDQLYSDRKNSPTHSYGILTGYGLIDQATAGVRRKHLYLHAGFGGHLKSTMMFNMIVNAAVDGGWNPLLFTSEMPAEEVQQILLAIHSANPKFNGIGRPLNATRLLLGALQPPEEDFYKLVKDDFINNALHGSVRIIDSGDFTTFGSVKQRTLREHTQEEVDILWVDYITRLPLDTIYRGMDTVTARNETIADAKRFAMSFDKGLGLPVCSPFQVNREGYKRAKTNEGRLDKTALAQYNAAEKEADEISYIYYDADEQATSEPKIGVMKARYAAVPPDPVSVFIEPDSRRIFDLTAGMSANTGFAPTAGSADIEEVVL